MKNFKKQRYLQVIRKMLIYSLPAAVFLFGSCSKDDEVIELTSSDLNVEIFEQEDPDVVMARLAEFVPKTENISILADEDKATGRISGTGVTRLILSQDKKFSGSKRRLYTSSPADGRAHSWTGTYYNKSMVIPPFTNVYLKNDLGQGYSFANKTNKTAKYIGDLGTLFTNTGRYIKSVELTTYQFAGTESLCGYAYTAANFGGSSMPVFRSTAMSETTLEGFGFNYFESFQSISDSQCQAVTFVNTDNAANTSSKKAVSDDNTDLGDPTYDAFYPEVSFDNVLGSYNSSSVNSMLDGFAVGVSDGNTAVSQDETDSCNSGYTICYTTVNALNYVATVATKLTCGGPLAIWGLSSSVLNLLLSGQWYQLGIIAGDAMITAIKIASGLATPIGEFDALICAVGVITKIVTGALNTGVCTTLKNKCTNTAKTTQKN